ncbi:hypothetical protein AB1N83_001228 [Pleurotus pulmonarius]
MQTSQMYISLSRMHHIISQKKFRRLKMSAEVSKISGWAKAGKPGVLVVQGQKQNIAAFLERVRVLRLERGFEYETLDNEHRRGPARDEDVV